MTKELREKIVAKTHELMEAPSCNPETRKACERWLSALGTDREDEATALYLKDMREAIVPIDGLIAFAGSEQGKKVFGEELAANIEKHAHEIKAEGAKYCDCPACSAAQEIIRELE